jgi:transcriptional regulator with XRE-family HTH domain
MPMRGEKAPAADLRDLMREHGLTQRAVAELACVSIKTVEGWLADAGAASHRNMHPRHLRAVRAMLPGYLAAQRGRKV